MVTDFLELLEMKKIDNIEEESLEITRRIVGCSMAHIGAHEGEETSTPKW